MIAIDKWSQELFDNVNKILSDEQAMKCETSVWLLCMNMKDDNKTKRNASAFTWPTSLLFKEDLYHLLGE